MRFLIMATLLLLSVSSYATPATGKAIPALTISDKGEIVIDGNSFRYRPWSTEQLSGRWTLLQYMAARPRASTANRHVVDAVALRQSEGVDVDIVNIINVRDVPFGAVSFALGELQSNKRKYPDSTLVADMDTGRPHWQLAPGGSTVFLVDPNGVLRFFKEGSLSPAELNSLLALLPQSNK